MFSGDWFFDGTADVAKGAGLREPAAASSRPPPQSACPAVRPSPAHRSVAGPSCQRLPDRLGVGPDHENAVPCPLPAAVITAITPFQMTDSCVATGELGDKSSPRAARRVEAWTAWTNRTLLCPFVRMSVRPSVRPSVLPSFRPSSLRPSVRKSVHSSVRPTVRRPSFRSFGPSIHPSVCPSARQSFDRLFICPTIRSSVHPSGRAFIDPRVHRSVRSSARSTDRASVHPSVRTSVRPFVRSSACPFLNPAV